jgi:hypothetical protein
VLSKLVLFLGFETVDLEFLFQFAGFCFFLRLKFFLVFFLQIEVVIFNQFIKMMTTQFLIIQNELELL